jgi:hypothetical protein
MKKMPGKFKILVAITGAALVMGALACSENALDDVGVVRAATVLADTNTNTYPTSGFPMGDETPQYWPTTANVSEACQGDNPTAVKPYCPGEIYWTCISCTASNKLINIMDPVWLVTCVDGKYNAISDDGVTKPTASACSGAGTYVVTSHSSGNWYRSGSI